MAPGLRPPGDHCLGCGNVCRLHVGELPAGIQDGDPRPDLVGWQAWAEPVLGAPYLWCATFSASTPHDLVAAFAASIASPAPVRRRILPELAAGRLTFSLPG